MNCTICSSTWNVANHHHPRRSAGTQFGDLVIPIDDPRRLFLCCGLCHMAIHERRLILNRFRDGLWFTLNGVQPAPDAKDSDILIDVMKEPTEVVWGREYYPGNVDEYFGEVVSECRADVADLSKRVEAFLPYATDEHWKHLIVEIAELNSRQFDRLRTTMRVRHYNTSTFGWDESGKPVTDEARKRKTAEAFGVGLSTVKEDLAIVEWLGVGVLADDRPRSAILEEARESRRDSDDSECRHSWEWLTRRCRICKCEEQR